MGYRSDVRIITSRKGFEKLSEFVINYLKEKGLDIKNYNLLKMLEINVQGKEQYYFGWNGVKWYDGIEGYEDVNAIMKGLDYLSENEYSYRYMIIGESYDDIEEQSYDGAKDEDIYLEYPCMIREFDDDYLKSLIEEKQLDTPEENKEEIDI